MESGGAESDVLPCPSGGGPGEASGQADHAEVVRLGSSINKMAQLTRDCPSQHSTGMMPLLELPWDETVKHLNDFSEQLRASGY